MTGHARFRPSVPLWSGLVCHLGEDVPVPENVISMMDVDLGLALPDCTLAVLAGCQSGLALAGAGNEYVSLVGAFLNAGANLDCRVDGRGASRDRRGQEIGLRCCSD